MRKGSRRTLFVLVLVDENNTDSESLSKTRKSCNYGNNDVQLMLGQLSQSLTLFRVLYRWANATIPMLCRFIRTKENFHGYLDSNGRGPKRGKEVSENDACEETTEAPLEEPDVKKTQTG